jgi:hypothetical protein
MEKKNVGLFEAISRSNHTALFTLDLIYIVVFCVDEFKLPSLTNVFDRTAPLLQYVGSTRRLTRP